MLILKPLHILDLECLDIQVVKPTNCQERYDLGIRYGYG